MAFAGTGASSPAATTSRSTPSGAFAGIVLYVEAENLYDRENVRRYTWNQKTNERQAWTQLPLLVLGGINLEF